MKRFLTYCLSVFFTLSVFAQQDPQVSMNMFNHMTINPGYAGSNEAICLTAIQRQQWMGFEGSPMTTIFEVNTPINPINSGIGLSIYNDEIGNETDLSLKVSYAYRLEVGMGKLGMGLSFGLLNKAFDENWVATDDPNSDPKIPGKDSRMGFDAGFGLFYRTNDIYLGLSSTHLTQQEIKFPEQDNIAKVTEVRHYYITSGYNYQLPANPLIELRPSVLIKSDFTSSQFDINLMGIYNKRFFGGVSFRAGSFDALIAMLGMQLKNNLRFAVAYDLNMSKLSNYNSGSLEIMVGYCFNIIFIKNQGGNKSVRWL